MSLGREVVLLEVLTKHLGFFLNFNLGLSHCMSLDLFDVTLLLLMLVFVSEHIKEPNDRPMV